MDFSRPVLPDARSQVSYDNSSDQMSAAQMQKFFETMASANMASSRRAAPQAAKTSVNSSASLSSLLGPKPNVSASSSVMDNLNHPDLAGFKKLIADTDAVKAIMAASAEGKDVTILAPNNKALLGMTKDGLRELADKGNAHQRNMFASQHFAPEWETKNATTINASTGLRVVGGAYATANESKHVKFLEGDDGPMAALYNNDGDLLASAPIVRSITDFRTGVTVHELSQALVD